MDEPEMPMTDAEIGDTLRRLARACSPEFTEETFQWYARKLRNDADHTTKSRARGESISVKRAHMTVDGGRLDGMLERLVEFVIGTPCGVVSEDQHLRALAQLKGEETPQ